jgi:hypothetical protein
MMSRLERKASGPVNKPAVTGTNVNPPTNVPLNTSIQHNVGFVPAAVTTVPEVKEEVMSKWLDELYGTINMSAEELNQYWDAFAYQGFNRADVLKQLRQVLPDVKLSSQIVVLIALRGPQAASNIKLLNGRTPIELGIPASAGQGTKTLTCNKILSATADLAAAFLKRMNAPKRMDISLPGWLQFPSAGSIKLPEDLRRMHEDFTKAFSSLIGGSFQYQIYQQMVKNAYLDPKLRLFEPP